MSSATHILIDVQGYFTASGSGSTPGGFVPAPNGGTRIFDSRIAGATSGQLSSGRTYTVSGATPADGVPTTATALFANITVIDHATHPGFITPWPAGASRPPTSLNFPGRGQTALGSVVGVNSAGQFSLYVGSGSGPIDVIIDVQGYYTGASTLGGFTAQSSRVYDSRASARLRSGSLTKVEIAGLGGIPSVARGLAAESVNVELVSHNPTDGGYLWLWGTNQAEPNTSDLNVGGGLVRYNLVTVVPGSDDSIWIRSPVAVRRRSMWSSTPKAGTPAPRWPIALVRPGRSRLARRRTQPLSPSCPRRATAERRSPATPSPPPRAAPRFRAPAVLSSSPVWRTQRPTASPSPPRTAPEPDPRRSCRIRLQHAEGISRRGDHRCPRRGRPTPGRARSDGNISAPTGHDGVLGPSGQVLFLAHLGQRHPKFGLPTAFHGTTLRVYPPGNAAALYLLDARPFCNLGVGPVTATP